MSTGDKWRLVVGQVGVDVGIALEMGAGAASEPNSLSAFLFVPTSEVASAADALFMGCL